MDSPKPLSYQSLKSVFQHVDPDKRIFYAAQIPSLRKIHKSVPMKIDILKLGSTHLSIDELFYSYGNMISNQERSMQWSDNIGIEVYHQKLSRDEHMDETLVQGDILIEDKRKDFLELIRQTEHDKHVRIQNLEQFQRFLEKQKQNLQPLRQFFFGQDAYFQENKEWNEQMINWNQLALDDNQKSIEFLRDELNSNPNSFLVRCILASYRRNISKSLYFPKGYKISDILRKQIQNFLPGRHVLQVRRLEIDASTGILRLPKSLKLKIQELSVEMRGNAMIESIKHIIDVSSFPLNQLSIKIESKEDPIFQNKILRSSKSLEIRNILMIHDSWSDVIINLQNQEIHFLGEVLVQDLTNIAYHWIKHPRSIGTKLSMLTENVEIHLHSQKELNRTVEGKIPSRKCDEFPICGTIQISATSELNFYGIESPNHQEELVNWHGKAWMFVMEVMPMGSAEPI